MKRVLACLVFTALLHGANAQNSCGVSGVTATVSPDVASIGQSVEVTLTNNSNQTITLPSGCVFVSVFSGSQCSGAPVFTPFCTQILIPIAPGESRSASWDQLDDNGQQVPAGSYSIEIRYFDGAFNTISCCVSATVVPAPAAYCTAKTNSCASLPGMGFSGTPSAAAGAGFTLSASNTKATRCGLLIYTDAGARSPAVPFSGGLLCINSPVRRTTAVCDTGGTPGQCDGTLAIDMNAFAAGALGGNPLASLTTPGTRIDCQMWGRDTLAAGALLSDALAYFVGP